MRAEITYLKLRLTETYLPVGRHSRHQTLSHRPTWGIVGIIVRILRIIGGVVSLAPYPDEARLDAINDVGVLLEVRFKLLDMTHSPLGSSIPRFGFHAIGVLV